MVEDFLKEAVATRNKVAIPGFGTFSTKVVEATYNEEQEVYSPPQKTISFVDEIGYADQDDSLVHFVATKTGLNELEAEEQVGRFITEVKDKIKNDEEYPIEGFGYFHKGLYGNTDFTPYDDVNLLPDSFGLPKIQVSQLPAVADRTVLEEAETKDDSKFGLIMIPLVVVIFAIILIFVSPNLQKKVWGLVTGNSPTEQVGPSTATTTEQPTETATTQNGTEENGTEQNTSETNNTENTTPAATPTPKETVKPTPTAQPPATTNTATSNGEVVENKTGRWYLSIASFTELGLAKNDVAKLRAKGYTEAKVVVGGPGKYRVSLADFASKSEADAKVAAVSADYKNIWVFKF